MVSRKVQPAFCLGRQELVIWQEFEFKVGIKIENCWAGQRVVGQTKLSLTVESLCVQKPTQSNIRVHTETTNQSYGYGAKPFSGILGLINSSLTKYVAGLVVRYCTKKKIYQLKMLENLRVRKNKNLSDIIWQWDDVSMNNYGHCDKWHCLPVIYVKMCYNSGVFELKCQ